jgi:hypothetical protein
MYQEYNTYEEFKNGLFSRDIPEHDNYSLRYGKISLKIDDCVSIRIKSAGVYRESAIKKYWNIYEMYFHNCKYAPMYES